MIKTEWVVQSSATNGVHWIDSESCPTEPIANVRKEQFEAAHDGLLNFRVVKRTTTITDEVCGCGIHAEPIKVRAEDKPEGLREGKDGEG